MMGNQTQLDVNLLVGEYEAQIALLMRENIQLKTLLKQKSKQEQEERELAAQHVAPPAPPEVPVEMLEQVA
ncbi:hypothetical protein ABWK22_02525 [Gottfriedia acidiceleris]|uniref:hypothetical protein n=1 Tax=Gottfriedia acidiceleris TaxID=371036 RepID=UPI003399A9B0